MFEGLWMYMYGKQVALWIQNNQEEFSWRLGIFFGD